MKAAREGTEPEKTEEKKEVKLDYLDPRTNKFDLDTLKTKFPQGVDPTMKE